MIPSILSVMLADPSFTTELRQSIINTISTRIADSVMTEVSQSFKSAAVKAVMADDKSTAVTAELIKNRRISTYRKACELIFPVRDRLYAAVAANCRPGEISKQLKLPVAHVGSYIAGLGKKFNAEAKKYIEVPVPDWLTDSLREEIQKEFGPQPASIAQAPSVSASSDAEKAERTTRVLTAAELPPLETSQLSSSEVDEIQADWDYLCKHKEKIKNDVRKNLGVKRIAQGLKTLNSQDSLLRFIHDECQKKWDSVNCRWIDK